MPSYQLTNSQSDGNVEIQIKHTVNRGGTLSISYNKILLLSLIDSTITYYKGLQSRYEINTPKSLILVHNARPNMNNFRM